jgi:hypothetical protein
MVNHSFTIILFPLSPSGYPFFPQSPGSSGCLSHAHHLPPQPHHTTPALHTRYPNLSPPSRHSRNFSSGRSSPLLEAHSSSGNWSQDFTLMQDSKVALEDPGCRTQAQIPGLFSLVCFYHTWSSLFVFCLVGWFWWNWVWTRLHGCHISSPYLVSSITSMSYFW